MMPAMNLDRGRSVLIVDDDDAIREVVAEVLRDEGYGVVCAANQMCTPTGCSTTCPAPGTYCNGSCVDLATALDNCGACGTVRISRIMSTRSAPS